MFRDRSICDTSRRRRPCQESSCASQASPVDCGVEWRWRRLSAGIARHVLREGRAAGADRHPRAAPGAGGLERLPACRQRSCAGRHLLRLWHLAQFAGRGDRLYHHRTQEQFLRLGAPGRDRLRGKTPASGSHHPGMGCERLARGRGRADRPVPQQPVDPVAQDMTARLGSSAGPSRRQLIGLSAGACCAGLCGRPARGPAQSLPSAPLLRSAQSLQARPTMLTRTIPQSQEPLPVVGFGTWQTFDIGTDRSQFEQRREVLAVLFEAGGKVIDSSPMYGSAEAVVGQLLSEMQAHEQAFLATKVWTSGEAAGRRQMEASFANLKTRSIDLMQIHNLVDWRTQLKTLRAWKEAKRFRYIGVTHYTVAELDSLAAIIRHERLDFVQLG